MRINSNKSDLKNVSIKGELILQNSNLTTCPNNYTEWVIISQSPWKWIASLHWMTFAGKCDVGFSQLLLWMYSVLLEFTYFGLFYEAWNILVSSFHRYRLNRPTTFGYPKNTPFWWLHQPKNGLECIGVSSSKMYFPFSGSFTLLMKTLMVVRKTLLQFNNYDTSYQGDSNSFSQEKTSTIMPLNFAFLISGRL